MQLTRPLNVKNTMLDDLLRVLAPHHCSGCGQIGTLLCGNCKYHITSEPYARCIVCLRPSHGDNLCTKCRPGFELAWCVAERRDALTELIDGYKFDRRRAAYRPIADLLDASLPEFPDDLVVVPIPTVRQHVRQRGYDHARLIAKRFARLRHLRLRPLLSRASHHTQRGASRALRMKQAAEAFRVSGALDPSATYLLIDDVYTTGATRIYATRALKAAGARHVWIAIVARQTLD